MPPSSPHPPTTYRPYTANDPLLSERLDGSTRGSDNTCLVRASSLRGLAGSPPSAVSGALLGGSSSSSSPMPPHRVPSSAGEGAGEASSPAAREASVCATATPAPGAGEWAGEAASPAAREASVWLVARRAAVASRRRQRRVMVKRCVCVLTRFATLLFHTPRFLNFVFHTQP